MLRLESKLFFNLARWLALFFILTAGASRAADASPPNSIADWTSEATNALNQWIWETNSSDKQTCRFWKTFVVPGGDKVSRATMHITVDNGYTLFLDGAEIGRGSDWRTVTEYDVTQLLSPGPHIVAVEGFNDRLEGGLIFGMVIQFPRQPEMRMTSDQSWFIAPTAAPQNWAQQKRALPAWHHAVVVGSIHTHPWEMWPMGLAKVAPLQPVMVHFWQRGWFQLSLLTLCLLALSFCLALALRLTAQAKAQTLLQVERARIARDIHDDLGAQLTQLVLLGEVAQSEQPEASPTRRQFQQICQQARDLSQAMDEVVWAVNSRRDTVRDFASYVCKYAQLYLSPTATRCRLDVEAEIPATEFDLPVRRNLFLAVKEALNNAAKHARADELFLRIYRQEQKLIVVIEDNGLGFDPLRLKLERNGLTNMTQRMAEIGGACDVVSQPGLGCRVTFRVPLKPAESRLGFGWLRRRTSAPETNQAIASLHLPPELAAMKDNNT